MEILRSINAALRYIPKLRFNIQHAVQTIRVRRPPNRVIRRLPPNLRDRRFRALHPIHKKNPQLQAGNKLRRI